MTEAIEASADIQDDIKETLKELKEISGRHSVVIREMENLSPPENESKIRPSDMLIMNAVTTLSILRSLSAQMDSLSDYVHKRKPSEKSKEAVHAAKSISVLLKIINDLLEPIACVAMGNTVRLCMDLIGKVSSDNLASVDVCVVPPGGTEYGDDMPDEIRQFVEGKGHNPDELELVSGSDGFKVYGIRKKTDAG